SRTIFYRKKISYWCAIVINIIPYLVIKIRGTAVTVLLAYLVNNRFSKSRLPASIEYDLVARQEKLILGYGYSRVIKPACIIFFRTCKGIKFPCSGRIIRLRKT